MDRNYTGGWLQKERLSQIVSKKEVIEVLSFDNVRKGLIESFNNGMKRNYESRDALTRPGISILQLYDTVHRCSMCKNLFTINRSYGKHDCYAHYGYRDYTNPGAPRWSCCGGLLSDIGCMECDHLPEEPGRNAARRPYSNPTPTMDVPLGAALFGASLPPSKSFFFKRYLKDQHLKGIVKKNPTYLRVKLRYLEESMYKTISTSPSLAHTRARYFPYVIDTNKSNGKQRIYINMHTSYVIVPLYRRVN